MVWASWWLPEKFLEQGETVKVAGAAGTRCSGRIGQKISSLIAHLGTLGSFLSGLLPLAQYLVNFGQIHTRARTQEDTRHRRSMRWPESLLCSLSPQVSPRGTAREAPLQTQLTGGCREPPGPKEEALRREGQRQGA